MSPRPRSARRLRCAASTMMRVTRIAKDGVEMLRVEGRLTHENVEELRMACTAFVGDHGSVALDVSGLRFVDQTGVAMLHDLEQQGARITGCSGFVRELLRDRGESTTARPAPPPQSAVDTALVERLRRGDADAFEAVVRAYGGRMLATARRFVGDEDSRDVVQEAFIAAFRNFDGF